MVDCDAEICKRARGAGLGVAGVPRLSGDERGGGIDVNAGGHFGIKNRRPRAAARKCYASNTTLITVRDLFIDLYILPQLARRLMLVSRPTEVEWHDTPHCWASA